MDPSGPNYPTPSLYVGDLRPRAMKMPSSPSPAVLQELGLKLYLRQHQGQPLEKSGRRHTALTIRPAVAARAERLNKSMPLTCGAAKVSGEKGEPLTSPPQPHPASP
ncbi:uncharacterized protein LOC144170218 [Haemaphysalis longicornis]